jgi:hypothetical protein
MQFSGTRLFSFLVIIVLCFSLITGCDKNNPSSPVQAQENFLWIHFNADSTKIEFETLPKIDADGEEAIQLSSFIDTTLIHPFKDKNGNLFEARKLYSYQIVGDDGFSVSVKGYPNNTWQHLTLGHILTSTRQVVFPDDKIDLAGAYNVKTARHIYIQRKFDIITPYTITFVEPRTMAPISVTNLDGQAENALVLKDFITPLISAPQNQQYNLRTLDDFGPSSDLTWDQFQTGYWLLTSETTMFTDPALNSGKYKLKVLEKILVK